MGIIVADGILPSGIRVSNVYMSFFSESVYVKAEPSGFSLSACYRVFKDPSKQTPSDMRVPMFVAIGNSEINGSIYDILYRELKKTYPNSTDFKDNVPMPPEFPMPPSMI
jgi:hypothetical protein